MGIKQLSELQSQLQKVKEENKNAEVKLLMAQGLSREKVCYESKKDWFFFPEFNL